MVMSGGAVWDCAGEAVRGFSKSPVRGCIVAAGCNSRAMVSTFWFSAVRRVARRVRWSEPVGGESGSASRDALGDGERRRFPINIFGAILVEDIA